MVLAEAQSCSKSVLAGDSSGTAGTIVVGETEFIVDCGSSQQLAAKIVTLLDNPIDLKSFGFITRKHLKQPMTRQFMLK
jgi:phosphatidylinositol alpha-1,6-mannosyltransferase